MIQLFKFLNLILFILQLELINWVTNGEQQIINTTKTEIDNASSYDATPISDLESPQYTIIETFKNIELRKYNPNIWISVIWPNPTNVREDWPFMCKYGYEFLSKYFAGYNIGEIHLTYTTPLLIKMDIYNHESPRRLSLMLPTLYKDLPPAAKFPMFFTEAKDTYYYVTSFEPTSNIRSLFHKASEMMATLAYTGMPFDINSVTFALFEYPPNISTNGDVDPIVEEIVYNEIWIERIYESLF